MKHMISGQVLLIVCCALYLVFWSLGYRPGAETSRFRTSTMIFLFLTALSGLAGTGLTIAGMNSLTMVRKTAVPGWVICIAGIVLYVVLLGVTGVWMHRPVTTELFLITGWLVLELCMIHSLGGAGMGKARLTAMLVIILAAWAVSMVLYALYYRMDGMKAYYAAMVPLITEAAGMAGCLLCICL